MLSFFFVFLLNLPGSILVILSPSAAAAICCQRLSISEISESRFSLKEVLQFEALRHEKQTSF